MRPFQKQILYTVTSRNGYKNTWFSMYTVRPIGKTTLVRYLTYWHGAVIIGGRNRKEDMKTVQQAYFKNDYACDHPIVIIALTSGDDRLSPKKQRVMQQIMEIVMDEFPWTNLPWLLVIGKEHLDPTLNLLVGKIQAYHINTDSIQYNWNFAGELVRREKLLTDIGCDTNNYATRMVGVFEVYFLGGRFGYHRLELGELVERLIQIDINFSEFKRSENSYWSTLFVRWICDNNYKNCMITAGNKHFFRVPKRKGTAISEAVIEGTLKKTQPSGFTPYPMTTTRRMPSEKAAKEIRSLE